MEIVGKDPRLYKMSWDPKPELGGRQVLSKASKVHRRQLVADARPDSAQKTGCQGHRFSIHRCTVGPRRHFEAVENRFTPQLVGFLRAVLEATVLRALAASPQTVDLLNKFTSVRIGDSSTIALPDELADQFPGCGGHLAPGLAAMKIHLLWDFLTGSILQLRITPGASDATNPIAQEVAPAGSLSLFDLGYFCLDRFQYLMRAGAFWISPLQHGTSVFDAQGQPLVRSDPAAADRVGTDRRVGPAGVSHRLPCRLIALRVPQEVADRGRKPTKAQKTWPRAFAGVSRMAGLDDLRDQLRAGIADVGGRRRALPRGGRSN